MYNFRESLTRQRDLIPFETLATPVTIIGAGAVGSWTALALVKMGFADVRVYDHDEIDVENMNCQFYPHASIGMKKVDALRDMIKTFTGIEISTFPRKYQASDTANTPIVISAVDSMAVRREIFDSCGHSVRAFIDPRMGAETMAMYTMNPNDIEDMAAYIKSWHSDEDGVHERCTAKATIYCANILAGLVANNVKKIATNDTYTRVLTFDLPSMGMNAWSKQHETQTQIPQQAQ